MFPLQMVRLKILEPSSGPLLQCFPRKWYALKLFKFQTFSMFHSQILCFKIVNPKVSHFFNVSLANGTPENCRTLKLPTFCMFPIANGTPWNCRTLKWLIFSMFPSQILRLKIVKPSSLPLFAYFTRKWYALKLSNPQVAHFFYVSLANGTP